MLAWSVAALIGAAALASACGGDGGGPLSASEFRERGEEICREIEETTAELSAAGIDIDRDADEYTAVLEQSVADMRSLEPPAEFRERWREYLMLLDELSAMFRDFIDQIEGATEEEVVRIAGELQPEFRELEKRGHAIERELGLDECAT
jgi:hypothetical protein